MTETKVQPARPQGHHPRQPERGSHLREVLARQKSLPPRRARRPRRSMPPRSWATSPRRALGVMPELSEIEIIRHFTRLSTWNYAIDLGMYPLGSCTMKYNPRVNELVARLEGIADAHPYQPESLAQGCLGIMTLLQSCLIEITGMDAITLQPAAGAHGEFTGILLARAYHRVPRQPAQKGPHPRLRPRHQSRHGGHGGLPGGKSQVERAGHGGPRRARRAWWTKTPPR